MAQAQVDFHKSAFEELQEAYRWYHQRSNFVADDFLQEVDRATELIAEAPTRWAKHLYSTLRFIPRKFPFVIICRPSGNRVRVFAVAHTSRSPNYWQDRLD